jgi:hypothetical protein
MSRPTKFEPTSKSAELDHEGALRSFEASPPHSSLWPRSLLEIPHEIPKVAVPIIATDSRLPETRRHRRKGLIVGNEESRQEFM